MDPGIEAILDESYLDRCGFDVRTETVEDQELSFTGPAPPHPYWYGRLDQVVRTSGPSGTD
ncbi:MAG: hypothetical protein ACOCUS_04435, partial [Polyangiales bacterium]